MSIFLIGTIVLFAAVLIFYIVFFSLIYYWHEKKTTVVVVPLLITFDVFLVSFLAMSAICILIYYFLLSK